MPRTTTNEELSAYSIDLGRRRRAASDALDAYDFTDSFYVHELASLAGLAAEVALLETAVLHRKERGH